MTTKNLAVKVAALALTGGIGSGCIVDDCLDTYVLNQPQVSVEPEFTERVNNIDLTIEARNNSYDYRGEYAYAKNLRLKCVPSMDNNCVDALEYEFRVNYITPEGDLIEMYKENRGSYDATLDLREFELPEYAEGGLVECIVWSPACATNGRVVVINGVEHYEFTKYRPRMLVGIATAEVGLSLVCPAPISPFKPVSDAELQNATSQ